MTDLDDDKNVVNMKYPDVTEQFDKSCPGILGKKIAKCGPNWATIKLDTQLDEQSYPMTTGERGFYDWLYSEGNI